MQLRFASYREVSSPSNVLKERSRLSRLAQFLSTCRLLFEKNETLWVGSLFTVKPVFFFPSPFFLFFFSSLASLFFPPPLFSFFFSISIRSSSSDLAHRLVRLVLTLLISRQVRLDSLITSSLNHLLKGSSELYGDKIAFLTWTFRLLNLTRNELNFRVNNLILLSLNLSLVEEATCILFRLTLFFVSYNIFNVRVSCKIDKGIEYVYGYEDFIPRNMWKLMVHPSILWPRTLYEKGSPFSSPLSLVPFILLGSSFLHWPLPRHLCPLHPRRSSQITRSSVQLSSRQFSA